MHILIIALLNNYFKKELFPTNLGEFLHKTPDN